MTEEPPRALNTAKKARKVRWSVRLGGPLITALAKSWRLEEVNAEPWRRLTAEGKAFALCFWHGELLVSLFTNRGRGMSAMVSEHSDGEIIAQVMERWGFRNIRGSSSRSAGRALLGMVRELQEGRSFAITPDGPRGPAGIIQQGILLASVRAGVPIVTVRCEAGWAWRMNSWDRFLIPKPFSRVRVIYGDPWLAPAIDDATARLLEERMGPALRPGERAE